MVLGGVEAQFRGNFYWLGLVRLNLNAAPPIVTKVDVLPTPMRTTMELRAFKGVSRGETSRRRQTRINTLASLSRSEFARDKFSLWASLIR